MAKAGYSGTPLIHKLGIKPGMKIALINQPDDYFEWLEANIANQLCKKKEMPDLVHLFATDFKRFERSMKKIANWQIKNPHLIIWISWYKKSAGIPTDLSEDLIRQYALQHDLVDIKVCAVNEHWSGLKLVVPLAKRK